MWGNDKLKKKGIKKIGRRRKRGEEEEEEEEEGEEEEIEGN